jgi:hypothetical protein
MDAREAVLLASHALAAALGLQTPNAPQLGARGIVHLSLTPEPATPSTGTADAPAAPASSDRPSAD